jgi:hypothetical protein
MDLQGMPIVAAIAFVTVKLLGYSAVGYLINRECRTSRPHPLILGATRTVLGLVLGYSVHFALSSIAPTDVLGGVIWLFALLPVRIGGWMATIWFFYFQTGKSDQGLFSASVRAALWSFALDVPALFFMFVLPGGIGMC